MPHRALLSQYFVLVFQCESLAKKEEMQCSFKVPQAYRSPTGFSFNFFAALKTPLSSRKKMVFSKTGLEFKNLLCSSLQEDAEMLSSLNFETNTLSLSHVQKVQIIHVQVLKGEKCTAYYTLLTGL